MSEDTWLARVRAANERGETLVDLDAVAAWMQRLTTAWQAHGLTVEHFSVTRDAPKNSVRMNIDGPTVVSTTIVWDSGEWGVSVGHVTDKRAHTSAYAPASSTDEVLAKVAHALATMGVI